ncbi:MAG: hypothetical protein LBH96_06880 [Candidatus Peribacteria bacterium]|jgi:hypothetical protein|nr:hypothetical protein [Candidatus Peribacteria bacterium]
MLGFNDQAYPTTNAGEVVASGIFLKGNFIINGIVSLPQNEQAQKNRVFIHGKFTSLNTYAEPSASRLTQVKDILKSSSISTKEVDLTQVFSWRCNYGS